MRVLAVSLGCDKNRVDAEVMLGKLRSRGHTFTDEEEQAEAVIVNTCCFIDAAKEESIEEILSFEERRKSGELKALIVTGCLAERYRAEIIKEIPAVDAVVGVTAIDRIAEVLEQAAGGRLTGKQERVVIGEKDPPGHGNAERVLTTGGHYEFLKIAEGCDKHCTYCVIPKIRGSYRSVPMEELVAEAQKLADGGVTELILVAQETTRYGVDLYGEKRLPALLKALCAIDTLHWIRLLYCYPEEIDDALIDVIASEKKICRYLDIPIQSGSDRILKRMGRRVNRAQIIELVDRLRTRIPGLCIRTTLIAGFPGETAADQRESMDLVRTLRFDRLGVFTYSREEGTPAAGFSDLVTARVMKTRRTKLMKLQQEVVRETAETLVGTTMEAVIEGRIAEDCDPENGPVYIARTERDAPDVDGYLFLEGVPRSRDLLSGSFVRVRVTGVNGYDLTGVLDDENESAE
ncbi:MAG: 30S ribosomal protein S12 methylthiotransferase RimO [Lachnospiraceae bacterium]|nr:30S ribosomal protein S12 methylthiotransferase RimO [Lachnospiraceae bacterium]